jgi:hypothetical protein
VSLQRQVFRSRPHRRLLATSDETGGCKRGSEGVPLALLEDA